jgi:hypothetical protein
MVAVQIKWRGAILFAPHIIITTSKRERRTASACGTMSNSAAGLQNFPFSYMRKQPDSSGLILRDCCDRFAV